ncbi:hypothetical protein [Streptomyces sp. C10-9-1]|uniref:hypothetical protein n=1 Tax=Streptomyces sp. C10-9-1 TaxID=1859285 RepID=UPI003F4A71AB
MLSPILLAYCVVASTASSDLRFSFDLKVVEPVLDVRRGLRGNDAHCDARRAYDCGHLDHVLSREEHGMCDKRLVIETRRDRITVLPHSRP